MLPGASGTHSVCICIKHQNVKLGIVAIETVFMHDDAKNFDTPEDTLDTNYILTIGIILPFSSVIHHRRSVHFDECEKCPEKKICKELITTLLDRKVPDEVEFRQWLRIDVSTLEYTRFSAEDFISYFHE